jgi:hypothetical protein
MRNTCDVLIDEQGIYLAVGVDRSTVTLATCVRMDLNKHTLLMGPTNARKLAKLIEKHADLAERPHG